MTRRIELQFQNHIIDSYKNQNGFAKKWATEWQTGNPDLICSIGDYGLHLAEVKHAPNFKESSKILNPLRPKQVQVCKSFINSGALVMAYIVGGEKAVGSVLYAFDPLSKYIRGDHPVQVPYAKGEKYDMCALLAKWHQFHGKCT